MHIIRKHAIAIALNSYRTNINDSAAKPIFKWKFYANIESDAQLFCHVQSMQIPFDWMQVCVQCLETNDDDETTKQTRERKQSIKVENKNRQNARQNGKHYNWLRFFALANIQLLSVHNNLVGFRSIFPPFSIGRKRTFSFENGEIISCICFYSSLFRPLLFKHISSNVRCQSQSQSQLFCCQYWNVNLFGLMRSQKYNIENHFKMPTARVNILRVPFIFFFSISLHRSRSISGLNSI